MIWDFFFLFLEQIAPFWRHLSALIHARVKDSPVDVVTLHDQIARVARFSCRFFTAMVGNEAGKKDIPKFGAVALHSYRSNLRRKHLSHEGVELWVKSINDFGNFERHLLCATSRKNHPSMYARVPQAMAWFVIKIEQLSHMIIWTTPILEMTHAYGLLPSLRSSAVFKQESGKTALTNPKLRRLSTSCNKYSPKQKGL